MSGPPSLAERAHAALGRAFEAQFDKILDGACRNEATTDADWKGIGIDETKARRSRANLQALKRAYEHIEAAIDEVFGTL